MPQLWIVLPALNEEAGIAQVLDELQQTWQAQRLRPPMCELAQLRCVVVDNGSSDGTADRASERGAEVVVEARRGYGQACLSGLAHLQAAGAQGPDIVVFLDADASDDASDLPALLEPLMVDRADFVLGSRVLGRRDAGALSPQQRVGNWLATRLIARFTGVRFSDLGPFRALHWQTLAALSMQDRDYGWTVEMQLKAASRGLRCLEVPVRYRRRIGKSKISGTLRGSWMAGTSILRTLWRFRQGAPARN
jgi:glycosyltransferase involved in cell wall biosynthesis